ncbi:hypothetical protein HPG69_014780, partial [Diceros bicornis minor]
EENQGGQEGTLDFAATGNRKTQKLELKRGSWHQFQKGIIAKYTLEWRKSQLRSSPQDTLYLELLLPGFALTGHVRHAPDMILQSSLHDHLTAAPTWSRIPGCAGC